MLCPSSCLQAWGPVLGLCILYGAVGACLTPWSRAYALLLRRGHVADARTLWCRAPRLARSGLDARRDGMMAGLFASLAIVLSLSAAEWPRIVVVMYLFFVALAWLDWRSGLLPDALTLPLMLAGWLLSPQGILLASSASALIWAGLALLAGGYRLFRGRDGFGGGDVKCLAALAGWIGLTPALIVLWLACVLGVSCYVLVPRMRRPHPPFGPCIAAACLPLLVAGSALQSWF